MYKEASQTLELLGTYFQNETGELSVTRLSKPMIEVHLHLIRRLKTLYFEDDFLEFDSSVVAALKTAAHVYGQLGSSRGPAETYAH